MGITFYVLCYGTFPYVNGRYMNEMREDNFYSHDLKDIISQMIQLNPNKRPYSGDIYLKFKQYYIKKFVKNSGIYSTIRCLFNFENFKNYFYNDLNLFRVFETKEPKKVSYVMIQIIQSLKSKEEIIKSIYVLRKILKEEGINKKDNEEITPLETISILLNSLNYELNTIKNVLSQSQEESKKKSGYIHVKDIPGEEGQKYQEFNDEYKKKFNSMISQNFQSILKIKRTCLNNNHINYLFRRFHFLPFNCDFLLNKLKNKQIITIYDAFECLNKNEVILGLNKYIKCPNCNNNTQNKEIKTFFETPNNLIIFFDRGQNNQNKMKIDFYENLKFNNLQVERNNGRIYSLIGVIKK
jgi:hypothetical protein